MLYCTLNQPFSYPWLRPNSTFPPCKTAEDRAKLICLTTAFSQMGEGDIVAKTGCKPSCKRSEYFTEKLSNSRDEDMPFIPGPYLFLQMYYPTNDYLERSEYFIYGEPSHVADFGGYLGLLMVHSLLLLYDQGKLFCRKRIEQINVECMALV